MRTSAEILKEQKFELGEPVEFAIKAGFDSGIVSAIIITPDCLLYEVIWSNKDSKKHYDFEIKKPKAI